MLNYSLNHNFRIHVYYCIHTIISNLVLFGEWFWLIHTTLLSPTAPLHHLWNSTGPIDRLCPTGCPQHHLANQPQIGTEWLRTQPGKDLRRVGEVYAAVCGAIIGLYWAIGFYSHGFQWGIFHRLVWLEFYVIQKWYLGGLCQCPSTCLIRMGLSHNDWGHLNHHSSWMI